MKKTQQTFADIEYQARKKKSRKEEFLDEMDKIIPWGIFCEIIEPFYYKNKVGRRATPLELILRVYFLQQWYSLSDEGLECEIYDSYAFRKFCGVNFSDANPPDATTLLHFRNDIILENNLNEKIFGKIGELLDENGLIMHGGSIIDATIISAPKSTKNQKRERDPEMHSTKKGGNWHFGEKIHIGVDSGSGLIHHVSTTSANVHDICEVHNLVREDDEKCYGDSAFISAENRPEMAEKFPNLEIIAVKRPSQIKEKAIIAVKNAKKSEGEKVTKIIVNKNHLFSWEKQIERQKSSVRCKVEYCFYVIKCLFHHKKAKYKGIAKNHNQNLILAGLANIYMISKAGRVFLTS